MSCINQNLTKANNNPIYKSYWSESNIKVGLSKDLIKGQLRLNSKNYKEGYVTHQKLDSDIFIFDKDINRALVDDIVAVKVNNKYDWKVLNEIYKLDGVPKMGENNNTTFVTIKLLLKKCPSFFKEIMKWNVVGKDLENNTDFGSKCTDWWRYFQRTGKVVGICSRMNSRHCVGYFSIPDSAEKLKLSKFIKFSPINSCYPRLAVPVETCPSDFLKRPSDYKDVKFIARIGEWSEWDQYPIGEISQSLKDKSIIEQETLKILVESGFVNDEFNEEIMNSLPKSVMTDEDVRFRRDFRDECVLSIDPKTARDLDDALHIKRLTGLSDDDDRPVWEVGVHIADVTYYVTPGSEIDKEASNRTTTVYMVHKAIPMLPRELCENLCSLNPGTDKLTYSVVFQMTDDCRILNTWIGRGIIRTACKLSYEEAQTVLDNPAKSNWSQSEFSEIFSPFTVNDIIQSILDLNHLATQMRRTRFENGSLSINQPKLGFVLNNERNCPLGFHQYHLGASNHLIEEWMLRANMSVAEFLYRHLPTKAFLRCHPAPNSQAINGLNKQFVQMGWDHFSLESGSTVEFQDLISSFEDEGDDHNAAIMNNICSKVMHLALYFCYGGDEGDDNIDDPVSFTRCRHFALNVPLYTHFTSPIRRYPDMIVHRQLTEILIAMETAGVTGDIQMSAEKQAKINWMSRTAQSKECTVAMLDGIAEWCNKRRKDAKSADENSIILFYTLFVESCGPFNESAVVMGTLDKAFDVLLTHCGFVRRVYLNQLDIYNSMYVKSKGKLIIYWNPDQACKNASHPKPVTILTMLSAIDVTISVEPTASSEAGKSLPKLKLVLRNPGCSECFHRFAQPVSGDDTSLSSADRLKDMTSLQDQVDVVDEDQLYNILEDI